MPHAPFNIKAAKASAIPGITQIFLALMNQSARSKVPRSFLGKKALADQIHALFRDTRRAALLHEKQTGRAAISETAKVLSNSVLADAFGGKTPPPEIIMMLKRMQVTPRALRVRFPVPGRGPFPTDRY